MKSTSIQEDKERLLRILIRDAFFKEDITLSSGKKSDFYIDARRVTLKAEGVYLCAKIILDMTKDEAIDAIGGPTLGADPILGAIAVLSFQAGKSINTFIVRKVPKAYGKQQQIEGPLLNPDSQVVLIDDVATTGKSIVQSIDALRRIGVKVDKAICIVDRQEGAKEALVKHNCELRAIFNSTDFL